MTHTLQLIGLFGPTVFCREDNRNIEECIRDLEVRLKDRDEILALRFELLRTAEARAEAAEAELELRKNAADGAGIVLRQMTDRALDAEARLAETEKKGREAAEAANQFARQAREANARLAKAERQVQAANVLSHRIQAWIDAAADEQIRRKEAERLLRWSVRMWDELSPRLKADATHELRELIDAEEAFLSNDPVGRDSGEADGPGVPRQADVGTSRAAANPSAGGRDSGPGNRTESRSERSAAANPSGGVCTCGEAQNGYPVGPWHVRGCPARRRSAETKECGT